MKYIFTYHAPYRWLYSPKTFYQNIESFFYWIKYIYQRAFRGYADCDVWSIDFYLCEILPSMLKQLKETKCSHPGYGEANTPEKWDALLDKIIEGFEAAKRVEDDEYYKQTGNITYDNNYEVTNENRKKLQQMWVLSLSDQALFKKRMKIFTKYFFELSD